MSTQEALLALMEQGLNQYLSLDPEVGRPLSKLHGKRILLIVSGLGAACLVPGPDGIQVLAADEEDRPDCSLEAGPLGFMRMAQGEGVEELFGGSVKVRGDTELAQAFGALLRELDIDWEEQHSKLTGDPIAHQVGESVRGAGDWSKMAGSTLQQNLGEYLQEEARILPARAESDDFSDRVDRLRDDLERLEARIRRLENRVAK